MKVRSDYAYRIVRKNPPVTIESIGTSIMAVVVAFTVAYVVLNCVGALPHG